MFKKDKQELVLNLKNELQESNVVIVLGHTKLPFSAFDAARRNALPGTKIKKVKNNLIKFAFKGTNHEQLNDKLKNENFIIMSNDLFNACKSARFFLDNNKKNVEVISGASASDLYSNQMILDLSSVESIQELQSKLLRVIKVVGENLLRVIKLKFEEKEKEGK